MMRGPTTDETGKIVKAKDAVNQFGDLLKKMAKQIAAALPRHIPEERFIRIVLTTMRRNPKLLACSQASVLGALMQAAQDGLEPDGTHAALVPYYDKHSQQYHAQYQPMYRGLMALARRSGDVSTIRAHVVHKGDVFKYELGLKPKLVHRPGQNHSVEDITHVYAVCSMKDGGVQFEVMDRSEVELVRARSRAKDDGPWVTDWPDMARKSAVRRLLKYCPTSAEIQRAITVDEDRERGEDVDYEISEGEVVPALPEAIEREPMPKEETKTEHMPAVPPPGDDQGVIPGV